MCLQVVGGVEGENLQLDSLLNVQPDEGASPTSHEITTQAETMSLTLNRLSRWCAFCNTIPNFSFVSKNIQSI